MDEGEASAPVLIVNENVSEDGTKVKPTNNNVTRRICLVGDVAKDERTYQAAKQFGVTVLETETGWEFDSDNRNFEHIFVMRDFTGTSFDDIYNSQQRIVGPTALQQYASKEGGAVWPINTRPLYTHAMSGLVICFTGFRKKEDLTRMMQLIHNMGGSIRKEMSTKVTHLIANCCDGDKYTYASTFRVPIVGEAWVQAAWDRRDDPAVMAGSADMMAAHKLKPFHNASVCFHGFPDSERRHMTDVLVQNGGRATEMDDPACSYVVVEIADPYSLPPAAPFAAPALSPSCSSPPPKLPRPSVCVVSPTVRSCVSPDRSCSSAVRSWLSPGRSWVSPYRSRVSPERSCLSPDPSRLSPDPSRLSPDPSRLSPDPSHASPPRRFRPPLHISCVSPLSSRPPLCLSPPARSSSPPGTLEPLDMTHSFMESTQLAPTDPRTTDPDAATTTNNSLSDRLCSADRDQFTTPVKKPRESSRDEGFSSSGSGTFVSVEPGVACLADASVFKTPTSTPRRRSAGAPASAHTSPDKSAVSRRGGHGPRPASTFKTPALTRSAHRKSMSHLDFLLHRVRKHRHSSLTPDAVASGSTVAASEPGKHRKTSHKPDAMDSSLESSKRGKSRHTSLTPNLSVASIAETPQPPVPKHIRLMGLLTAMYSGKDGGNKVQGAKGVHRPLTTVGTDDDMIGIGTSPVGIVGTDDDMIGTSPVGIVGRFLPHNLSPIPFDIGLADSPRTSLGASSLDAASPKPFDTSIVESAAPAPFQSVHPPTPFGSRLESSSTPKRRVPTPLTSDGPTPISPASNLSPIPTHIQANSETHPTSGEDEPLTTAPPVVDESRVKSAFSGAHARATLVKAEWFWVSVQNETCADATEYRFHDYLSTMLSPGGDRRPSLAATPASSRGGARKRKRLLDGSSAPRRPHNDSPAVHKRRSSVSDAGLLSMSGSFLDATGDDLLSPTADEVEAGCQAADTPGKPLTARHHVFLELVQTETNYVDILHTIVTLFKGQLEEVEEGVEPLINKAEMKMIFGNLPPIYEVHSKMLAELRVNALHWREDVSVGKILLKYNESMESAYPPFINYFENMREMLTKCDQEKSRFHAFLKVCQTRPECGRQSLQELMIRPVQRLPSISLLLNDLLKHTPKSNADHACLEQALSKIKAAMTHINEDKRKTEGQLAMFEIFHEIDNCPPELLSSSRNLIARCDVIELGDGLSCRGDNLVLFVFSDTMEVCKKRSRAFNTLKSPSAVGHLKASSKPYKHLKQMPLTNIKRIIDVKEADDCRNAFALICRGTHDARERTYALAVADDETEKLAFLFTLASAVAGLGRDSQDANLLLGQLEARHMEVPVSTSDLPVGGGGTLGKAFKFATRTRLKVGRAFSFNKTPSKLKRAVSTMMGSPFVSTANLTPSSQLAQMRLASCSNLTEHSSPKEESTYVAPMSVQPTRKNKNVTQSLSVAALRRL